MTGFTRVELSSLLSQVKREEPVLPEREYALLGARLYAGGLFVRERKLGVEISAKRLNRVKSGDFVYSRLFAWKGAFALATDEVDDCHASGEFPTFVVKESELDARYLAAYFRQEAVWTEVFGVSTGSTPLSRNRLREDRFLKLQIPLPLLDEQQRIADRLDRVLGPLAEVRQRVEKAGRVAQALEASVLSHAFAGEF